MGSFLPSFPDVPDIDYTVTIEGVPYVFRQIYRDRTASWYLDVSDVDGNALLRGRRVSPGHPLNQGLITAGPPGALVPQGDDPYLQAQLQILYAEAAEIEAAKAEQALSFVVVVRP